ncbi:MAG: hypothetical protein IOD12_18445 [Silvanigrellales bacterium]|nr:hypothetical protein [Silvanigrellales bacterium]
MNVNNSLLISVTFFSLLSGCASRKFNKSENNAVEMKSEKWGRYWRKEDGSFDLMGPFPDGNHKVFSLNFTSSTEGILQCYYVIYATKDDVRKAYESDGAYTTTYELARAKPINTSYVYRDEFYRAMKKQLPREQLEFFGNYSVLGFSLVVGAAATLTMTPVWGAMGALGEAATQGIEAVQIVSEGPNPTTGDKIASGIRGSIVGFSVGLVQGLQVPVKSLIEGYNDNKDVRHSLPVEAGLSKQRVKFLGNLDKEMASFEGLTMKGSPDLEQVRFVWNTLRDPDLQSKIAVPKSRCLTGAELDAKPEKWWSRLTALSAGSPQTDHFEKKWKESQD